MGASFPDIDNDQLTIFGKKCYSGKALKIAILRIVQKVDSPRRRCEVDRKNNANKVQESMS